MKKYVFLALAVVISFPAFSTPAQALSCLPIDTYLKDVVGKDNIVIFEGTSLDKFEESGYTAEVLKINDVKQGYVENKTFVYHQKDETWGYLCNNGPKDKNSTGLYVAERDELGKYNVYQRLELNDPLVKNLVEDLKKAKVTGNIADITATDRMNQIITTISELIKEIAVLIKEHSYWKNNN